MVQKQKSTLPRLFAICALALTLIGCDQNSGDLSKLEQEARSLLKGVSEDHKKVQDATTKEVEKLFTFEYKVFDFSMEASSGEIEKKLSEGGREGWECFAVHEKRPNLRFFCKRRPKTYLRYVPRIF